ncbi:hypothetical protein J6590_008139 [Homalodisca vitripennis]|nr:hypothetical protein J6590_008139 [Homalodisca vitripennis]
MDHQKTDAATDLIPGMSSPHPMEKVGDVEAQERATTSWWEHAYKQIKLADVIVNLSTHCACCYTLCNHIMHAS